MSPITLRALVLLAVALLGHTCAEAAMTPVRLRCEYLVDPLVVGAAQPRLSWELVADAPDARQTAWQVRAGTAAGLAELWDSGKVVSAQQNQIAYAGKSPSPGRRLFWQARVWDREDQPGPWSEPATWGRGPSEWGGGWIGHPHTPAPWQPPHNGYHSALTHTPDATKWLQLDLRAPRRFAALQLHPARPFDWQPDTPGFLFPVRWRLEVCDQPDFAAPKVVVDRTGADQPNPGADAPRFEFEPVTARYVRLVVTRLARRDADIHAFALSQLRLFDGDTNVALHAAATALDHPGVATWSPASAVDGQLTTSRGQSERLPAVLLRREVALARAPRRAVVFVSALGLYELSLNGQRVGQHLLAPEWTDYRQRVQYQAYDITAQLKVGANSFTALLGDGWYAGRIGLSGIVPGGPPFGHYGRAPRLRWRLELELADGSRQVVVSDQQWQACTTSAVRANDLLDGETIDARVAPAAADWVPAVADATPTGKLVPQPNEPIAAIRDLRPTGLTTPGGGVWIFDLGQNMVGWCRLGLTAPAGTRLRLRYGEALQPDGTLYTANLRGAPQVDHYTCRGGGVRETFEPHFTYHGFRYVEVTGLSAKPQLGDLVGRVFCSAARDTGEFSCSAAPLNRLWSNILWTQRANLMSTPTDCPQRDERLGWMGDIQSFAQTGIFNQDLAAFFTKWLADVRDAQAADGRFPDFAPHPFGPNERFSAAPGWGDAGVIVPWRVYQNYGDQRVLAEHFDAARRWVDWIAAGNPEHLWRHGRAMDYNDWLNGDTLLLSDYPKKGGEVPREVFATAFWAHSTALVAQMAKVLGRADEERRYGDLAKRIRFAFNRAFVQPDGHILGDTQAGYALALSFDLLPDDLRPKAAQLLADGLERYGRRLSTGIQSTGRAMLELSRWGRDDLAWELLTSHRMPSWLYSVDQGATTVWERWDGYVAGRGFQNPGMNSLNHWAFGAVGEWLYRRVLGLQPDDDAPGWQHFFVDPHPGGGVTWSRGSYHSIRGPIAVAWEVRGERLQVSLEVPPNTAATVLLPDGRRERVGSGRHQFTSPLGRTGRQAGQ